MTKNKKEEQDLEQEKTIPVDILKVYLAYDTLDIPPELLPYIEVVDIPNTLISIYKVSRIILQKKESWNNDKSIIFTKNIKFQPQLDYDYSKDLVPIKKVVGDIDYIDSTLLSHILNKKLNGHSFLRLVSQTRYVPIKKDCYIDIDNREVTMDSTLLAEQFDDNKEFKEFDKLRVSYVYSNDIPSGLMIKHKEYVDKPSLLLKFNLFDKRDVVFKSIRTGFTIAEINETIKHLQRIIPNTSDLIFLSNQIKYHYQDPFEKTHRRIHIILYGGQGTGKTLITGKIASLFNSKVVNFKYNKNDNFIYIELKGAALVVMNEYKKTSESANFVKRISDTDIITINDKHEKKYNYPFYAMFISCCNPSQKNPISNLVEELEKQKDKQLTADDNYSIALSNDVFKKYFNNQKEYLLDKDKNFKNILQIEKGLKIKGSAVKTIIKEKDGQLITEAIKSSRCYTITKNIVDNIDIRKIDGTEYNLQQIIIQKKEFLTLQNELDRYLEDRKKNFEYKYD